VKLVDVIISPWGFLTGSARVAREAEEQAAALVRQQQSEAQERALARRAEALEARIAAMRAELEAERSEQLRMFEQHHLREDRLERERSGMAQVRQADGGNGDARHG
jgi:circadian clock protein KaiC